MRTVCRTTLVLASLLAVLHGHQAQAQIGGLIKKKAAEAVKGKDGKSDQGKTVAKDDGPITSQFEKECGPVTPDAIEKFLKGLQAEAAGRDAYDRKLAGTKPNEEVNACRGKETGSSEAMQIIQRGLANGGTTEYVQKTMEQNRLDLEKYLVKKCGEPASKYEYDKTKEYEAAQKAGENAAGLNHDCYNKLKEFALAFCKTLTPAQQKIATEQGIKVPGFGSGVWVFTADEAKAISPHCGELVPALKATGWEYK